MPSRAQVRLTLECNNRCVFCAQDGLVHASAPPLPSEAEWRALRERSGGSVVFTGGEPLLDPRLEDAVRSARAAGFERIGLQSNARGLADGELAVRLARAGLTDLQVTLQGAEPAVHDYHTGIEGGLVQTVAGLSAARAAGLEVLAVTVLTRSNLRSLATIPRLLGQRGVAGWLIQVPKVAGRAAAALERVVPRLGLALPFALHAMDSAVKLGIEAFIAGAPLCALGPFAGRALTVDGDDATGAFSEAKCGSCSVRARCPGLDPIYLRRFGDEELVTVSGPGRAVAGDARIRSSFVGVGELALREVVVADPPAAWRASIDVMGKGRPGVAEHSRGAEKKSGEALKEIFPELFGVAPEKPPYKPGGH